MNELTTLPIDIQVDYRAQLQKAQATEKGAFRLVNFHSKAGAAVDAPVAARDAAIGLCLRRVGQ